MRALHIDWEDGAPPMEGEQVTADEILAMDVKPADITILHKTKKKITIFNVQRSINDEPTEPLMAILPGVTLRDLWQTVGAAQKALFVVSIMVFIVSLVGMMIALISTLNERRREMSILRSIGASKGFIFMLLVVETGILSLVGIFIGIVILYGGLIAFQPVLESKVGLTIGLMAPTANEFYYILAIIIGAMLTVLYLRSGLIRILWLMG